MLYSLLLTALLPALTLNGQEATTQPKVFPVQEAHTIMVNGSSQQTFTPIRSASTSEIEVTPSESINGIVPWYSQPDELESKSFYRSGECYYIFFGQVTYTPVDGQVGYLAVGNNEVWIYSPFAEGGLTCWIKGEMDEEGNVKVKTPQCVAALTDNNTGNQIPLYLINIQQEIITEPDGSQYAIMVENPEESVITYKWDGEALTLIDGWLGACFWNSDLNVNNEGRWIWYGLADMQQKFQPCPYTALVPPGDLEYEDYVIAYTDPNTGTPLGATLKVGFIDDECWLKNLHPILTDFYVRGEKSNDGYIFHNQYLGLVDEVGYHAFFRPGFYVEKDGFRLIGDLPEMTMKFDTDTKTLHAPENISWMIGAGNGKLSYFQRNDDPYLYPYIVPTNPTLCTPEQLEYIEPYPEYDIPGTFCFHLPQFDEDNKWVDTKYLNFNIYIDGEIFTFDPEVYQGLDEPITDVPYLVPAWWYDFLQYNDSFMVYIYADNYSSLGVRLNYDNGDKHANSEIAYISTTGITPIESDDKVIDHIAYYDLNGLKINDPSNGICIKVTFFTDGSRKVSKITNR